ncbi:unnamed protein product [Lampetra planeri]
MGPHGAGKEACPSLGGEAGQLREGPARRSLRSARCSLKLSGETGGQRERDTHGARFLHGTSGDMKVRVGFDASTVRWRGFEDPNFCFEKKNGK